MDQTEELQPVPDTVRDQMREDWNRRAQEDANYYVAFGRREQDEAEFLATAVDVIRDLEGEIRRFPAGSLGPGSAALEIGCGPGRLMHFMSRHFGQIHGVDVSDEMIARAKSNLANVPNAFPRAASGSDLTQFADNSLDFVYSYAVFQHIPSAAVVFSYLRETVRVLRPGGFARLQINGLPKTAKSYTTWSGVRVSADEIHQFTRQHGIRLLSLTGIETQYMWTSWQKPPLVTPVIEASVCRIRHVVNAFSGEQCVPSNGRLACATFQMEGLPEDSDLNSLEVLVDGLPGWPCYIGPPVNGLRQLNAFLPKGGRTGLLPVQFLWQGKPLCPEATVRVIPAGPSVPRLTAVSDGVNLMSPQRIESGIIKIGIEEVASLAEFSATVDGKPVRGVESFRTDPLIERYELNFALPEGTLAGGHVLDIHLGKRELLHMGIEVV